MNIVIVGDGKVGFTLADYLSKEDHSVTLIDRDADALAKASEALDVLCITGNGANVQTLMEAEADKADILIAVTTSDEINMVCCLMARQLGAEYTIARIRDPEYSDSLTLLQRGMGIDMVINPEQATALEISRLLRFPFAANIESFAHGNVEMVEFRVDEGDNVTGQPIKALKSKLPKVLFCAIERAGEAIIPDGDFRIEAGDWVYVAGDIKSITVFFKQLGKNTERVRNAIIVGGGHISYYLAKSVAEMDIDLKLIEIDRDRCRELSGLLDEVTIINGDGTEQELLYSENIDSADALICLTNRDEENLMAGLYGVRSGAKKVIVKINRLNYMDLIGDVGIDSVVSPKRTIAMAILRTVRALSLSQGASVEKVYPIVNGAVEILEFTAPGNGRYLGKPLSDLNIKKDVLVAVLVRQGRVIIPFGSDCIEPGDTVILVTKASHISELEEALGR